MATPFTQEQVAWLQSVFGAVGLPAPGVPSKTSAAGGLLAPSPGSATNGTQASSALPPSSSGEQGTCMPGWHQQGDLGEARGIRARGHSVAVVSTQ